MTTCTDIYIRVIYANFIELCKRKSGNNRESRPRLRQQCVLSGHSNYLAVTPSVTHPASVIKFSIPVASENEAAPTGTEATGTFYRLKCYLHVRRKPKM